MDERLNTKQMTWKPYGEATGELYVKTSLSGGWKSYRTLPEALKKTDYVGNLKVGQLSKGFATMQHLLTLGWELV